MKYSLTFKGTLELLLRIRIILSSNKIQLPKKTIICKLHFWKFKQIHLHKSTEFYFLYFMSFLKKYGKYYRLVNEWCVVALSRAYTCQYRPSWIVIFCACKTRLGAHPCTLLIITYGSRNCTKLILKFLIAKNSLSISVLHIVPFL